MAGTINLQGTAGTSGAPPSPTAGVEMRAMAVSEAEARLRCARMIRDIADGLADLEITKYAEIIDELDKAIIAITLEAARSLLPKPAAPLPGPSGRPPIEPENRP